MEVFLGKSQIWFRNNNAAEKFSEEEIETILEVTYDWLNEDKAILLKTEVELYLLTTHSVSQQLLSFWINKKYTNNKSICGLYEAIILTLENRVVYDKEKMRPSVQGMVLQNKHNYREKKDIDNNVIFNSMPKITIDGKEMEIDI